MLARSTLALLFMSLLACNEPEDPSLIGTWTTYGEGTTGDRLVGTFQGTATLDDVDRTDEVHSEWHQLSLGADGGFRWTMDREYLDTASALAGCVEQTVWVGVHTREEVDGRARLTFGGAPSGEITRSGCADAADDGAATAPELARTLDARTLSESCFRGCTHFRELVLTEPAPAGTTPVVVFESGGRLDVANGSLELTFREDGTFRVEASTELTDDAWRRAGCVETMTLEGTFVAGDEDLPDGREGERSLSLSPLGEATITRASCADPSDDGTERDDAATAIGALGSAFSYGFWLGDLDVSFQVDGIETGETFSPGG